MVAVEIIKFDIDVDDEVSVGIVAVVAESVVVDNVVIVPVLLTVKFENVLLLDTSDVIVAKTGTKRLLVVLLVARICGVVMLVRTVMFEVNRVGV